MTMMKYLYMVYRTNTSPPWILEEEKDLSLETKIENEITASSAKIKKHRTVLSQEGLKAIQEFILSINLYSNFSLKQKTK